MNIINHYHPRLNTRSVDQQISSPSPSPSFPKKQKSFIAKKRDFIDIASETMKALNTPRRREDMKTMIVIVLVIDLVCS